MTAALDRRRISAEEAEGLRKIAVMMERAGINPALPFAKQVDIEAQRRLLQEQARMIREG
ncbi:MAG: hypothetical protein U1D97_12350 [Desulfuromonadales bacterium]|nr:hypothetical protein [Desulfuromonadales bacterium]